MRVSMIEPGGVYASNCGNVREVVSIEGDSLTYRVVRTTCKSGLPFYFVPGRLVTVGREAFARWADREVSDTEFRGIA